MFEITDSEIEQVEPLLLPNDAHFDAERRAIIKHLDTCDILACPGSGKTTVLLAKILILANKMPFDGNKGICVLTHTNVAIDNIKKGASPNASKLFNYPNHFGTIQSFVDKYIAIPAYINKFNKRPKYIDNEIFYSIIEKNYQSLHNAQGWLNNKREPLEYLKKLRFNKDNFCISEEIDGREFVNNTCATYREIKSLKLRILEWGYLCYEDAYSLAFKYLRNNPQLSKLFSKRFIYVFVDEMQDSSTIQAQLLSDIFDENVVIQKIGDLNQSIFDYDADLECGWIVNQNTNLCITGSKRFPNAIASSVQKLCVRQQTIVGNGHGNEIIPVIIVYDNNTIQQVLSKFGELIISNNLHQIPNRVFKAVGWRGKPHERERTTIPSYWTQYSKESRVKKTEFNNLKSYLVPQTDIFISSNGVNFYKKRIIDALLKCLRIAEITDDGKPFTEKTFYQHLIETNEHLYNELRLKIANWCLRIHKKENIFEEIKNFLYNEFKQIFNYNDSAELTNFINNSNIEEDEQSTLESSNIYHYSNGTIEIEIEVSTIHGVKGETHTATCYLETFYYGYDIKRIIEYMKNEYTVPTQKIMKQNLKIAFVGMSRPSHLLCVAVHQDSISGHEVALCNNGWQINTDLIRQRQQL